MDTRLSGWKATPSTSKGSGSDASDSAGRPSLRGGLGVRSEAFLHPGSSGVASELHPEFLVFAFRVIFLFSPFLFRGLWLGLLANPRVCCLCFYQKKNIQKPLGGVALWLAAVALGFVSGQMMHSDLSWLRVSCFLKLSFGLVFLNKKRRRETTQRFSVQWHQKHPKTSNDEGQIIHQEGFFRSLLTPSRLNFL